MLYFNYKQLCYTGTYRISEHFEENRLFITEQDGQRFVQVHKGYNDLEEKRICVLINLKISVPVLLGRFIYSTAYLQSANLSSSRD